MARLSVVTATDVNGECPALNVTIMGCGTSTGVPVVGCDCAVCTSPDPKNDRTRSGLRISFGDPERVILVDTSADLRRQCLRFDVRRVDAVLYTHAHADHIFGLDDLRPYNFYQGTDIDCFGSAQTLETLQQCFSYVFDGQASEGGGKPRLRPRPVSEPFDVLGLRIEPIPVRHGSLEVYGYRFGRFAHVTDTHEIPEPSMAKLDGIETLILDALRYRPHSTHFSVAEAIEVSKRIGAKRTILTHLNHEVDYNAPEVDLPPGVELAYDGLSFTV